jgi:hypothetical protein
MVTKRIYYCHVGTTGSMQLLVLGYQTYKYSDNLNRKVDMSSSENDIKKQFWSETDRWSEIRR